MVENYNDDLKERMARLETEVLKTWPATYVTKQDFRAVETRVADCENKVEDCEKSTDRMMSKLDLNHNTIIDRFEKSVVPAIQLNEKLIETTTRLKETQTQLALAQVETKTQTTQTTSTVTVTPAPIPPFMTIIKAWAASFSVIGGAFLILVAILGVLLAWWIFGVQHTPRP